VAFLCACDGSEFAADGSVIFGPATRGLPSVALRLDGDDALVNPAVAASPQDRV
jgi:Rieske Fe-S protein